MFTTLAFGGVHVWAISIFEVTIFSLLLIWGASFFLRRRHQNTHTSEYLDSNLRGVYIFLVIFITAGFLQTIPVSPTMLQNLSPKAYLLYSQTIEGFYQISSLHTLHRSVSLYPFATEATILKWMAQFGVFFLVAQNVKSSASVKRMATAILVIGVIEAGLGSYGYFAKKFYHSQLSTVNASVLVASGSFINRNHYASFLGLIIPFGIGYLATYFPFERFRNRGFQSAVREFIRSGAARKSGIIVLALFFIGAGQILSFSRAGLFSLFMSLLVMLGLVVMRTRFQFALGSFFFIFLLTVLWLWISPLAGGADLEVNLRWKVWNLSWNVIKDFPLWGTGAGTFQHIFRHYASNDLNQAVLFDHAHNDYLEVLLETGVIGFVLLAMAFILFWRIVLQHWRKSHAELKFLALGGLGSFTYLAIHSLADFSFHIPANALLFFLILGLSYSSVKASREKQAQKTRSGRPMEGGRTAKRHGGRRLGRAMEGGRPV